MPVSTAPPTPPGKPFRVEIVLHPSKKAKVKPNRYKKPGPIGNTQGIVVPRTDPGPPGGNVRPPVIPETPEEKNFLEKAKDGLQGKIDAAVEKAGDNKVAMAAGALGTALNEVFFPTALWELIPVGKLGKIAKKGAEVAGLTKKGEKAAEAAATAKKASGGGRGGHVKGPKKRPPKRRCELVPYKELECPKGSERHHVVPDWMLRLGKRGGPEQIPGMPSLDDGPAICLEGGSGSEHNTAHKHTDRPAARVGKSGKATGTPGTIKLGQAKAISSRAIEKATGGPKKGGCSREDIKKQLDEQFKAHDDAILRAVKDARKVTDEIRNATTRTQGKG